jgi:hypothetical protein
MGAAMLLLAAADVGATQIFVASYDDGAGNRGIARLQAGTGTNLGLFNSGAAPSTGPWRRLVFGADQTSDGNRELFLGTDVDGTLVFNGLTGVYTGNQLGTAGNIRQMATNPVNNDHYYTSFGKGFIGRLDSTNADKPGSGQIDDNFVPAGSLTFAVAIGPDGKVYAVDNGTLVRYGTAGGAAENSSAIWGGLEIGAMNFGPDLSGDGKSELYLTNFSTGTVDVVNVLANPASWTVMTDAVTGLSTPIGFNFIQGDMYIAELGAGRVSRYDLVGTTWLASPSPGNVGATFALLNGVQDIAFIPEPSLASVMMVGVAGILMRRRKR